MNVLIKVKVKVSSPCSCWTSEAGSDCCISPAGMLSCQDGLSAQKCTLAFGRQALALSPCVISPLRSIKKRVKRERPEMFPHTHTIPLEGNRGCALLFGSMEGRAKELW